MDQTSRNKALNHEAASDLLPWLVNGSLSAPEREQVAAHVRDCLTCRREFQEQKNLLSLVRQSATIPVSPQQGYEALMRKVHAGKRRSTLLVWISEFAKSIGRRLPPRRIVLVTTCGLAALILLVIMLVPEPLTDPTRASDYRTLTKDNRSETSLISVVFFAQAPNTDIRSLLAEVDGRIVAGPTAAGAYVVRLEGRDMSEVQVREALRQLAADPRVLSAEPARLQSSPR